MATYAVGDVQGCFDSLQALLGRMSFDPQRDRLLFVGDLVNRGPKNAELLRWAMAQGPAVEAVLGNHDIHLIGRHLGATSAKRRDTLDDVLRAPDRDALVGWLRRRPLAIHEGRHLIVHAGVLPSWRVSDVLARAREVEAVLTSDDALTLLRVARERAPRRWDESLGGLERARVALQGFTILRTLWRDGTPNLEFNGGPLNAPSGCRPWFTVDPTSRSEVTVVFGHWAALGLHYGDGAYGIDTGCVWGNTLTALRLDDHALFQQKAVERDLDGSD